MNTTRPNFGFGYWRPWREDSNLIDSYCDYVKDTQLVKYGADILGTYINQASKEQVAAINQMAKSLGKGLSEVKEEITKMNRNVEILIEQQRMTNFLLEDIAKLLRVPDSEKERHHSIQMGVKFFVNAELDKDLYSDALEEFKKAEALQKQDYFVLYRIGLIYLYVEEHLNIKTAIDYFTRAAKYSMVESDENARLLVDVLAKDVNITSKDKIKYLVSESLHQRAFAYYVSGNFDKAIEDQQKVCNLNPNGQSLFLLSKYQIRGNKVEKGISNLEKSIDMEPRLHDTITNFRELDFIGNNQVIELLDKKAKSLEENKEKLLIKLNEINSENTKNLISLLNDISKKSFEKQVNYFRGSNYKRLQNALTILGNSWLAFGENKNNAIEPFSKDELKQFTKLVNGLGVDIQKQLNALKQDLRNYTNNIKSNEKIDTAILECRNYISENEEYIDDTKSLYLELESLKNQDSENLSTQLVIINDRIFDLINENKKKKWHKPQSNSKTTEKSEKKGCAFTFISISIVMLSIGYYFI